jgi:hypothetical protein
MENLFFIKCVLELNFATINGLGEPRRTLMYRQFEVKVLRGEEEAKIRKGGLKCRKLKKGQNRDLKILENPRPVNLCGVFVCLGVRQQSRVPPSRLSHPSFK